MAVAATEPTGKKIEALRTMLSNSSTFQGAVSPSNSTEVLTHVHTTVYRVDGQLESDWDMPFAVIERDNLVARSIAQGSGVTLIYSGSLLLRLVKQDEVVGTPADGEQTFANWANNVLDDLLQISGQGTNVNIVRVEQAEPLAWSPLETERRHWSVAYRLFWGVAP